MLPTRWSAHTTLPVPVHRCLSQPGPCPLLRGHGYQCSRLLMSPLITAFNHHSSPSALAVKLPQQCLYRWLPWQLEVFWILLKTLDPPKNHHSISRMRQCFCLWKECRLWYPEAWVPIQVPHLTRYMAQASYLTSETVPICTRKVNMFLLQRPVVSIKKYIYIFIISHTVMGTQ